MKAREMMTRPVVTVNREASVAEAAKAMLDHKAGCVLVVDLQGKLRGIITQTDFAGDQHGATLFHGGPPTAVQPADGSRSFRTPS